MAMAATVTTTFEEARRGAERYLQERLNDSLASEEKDFGIPIIEIEESYSSSPKDRKHVANEIRKACLGSGFFYVTGHGIASRACGEILHQAERLFCDLPEDKKQQIHLKNSRYGFGWEDSTSTSLNGDVEQKEGFNWGYEDALDPTGGDGKYIQLDGTMTSDVNQWPSEEDLPGFRDGIKSYYSSALSLARHLCKLFALSLDLPEDYFDSMITHPSGNARLMYYPGASTNGHAEPEATGSEIGLGAHSDYQCFTILLCSNTPGLEILSPSGSWVTAPYVENGLIVNIGDMMMRWTNGMYKSTVHRVINRNAEPRFSVPLFFGINNDAIVETLPSCISTDRPSEYPPIKAGEYVLERLAASRAY